MKRESYWDAVSEQEEIEFTVSSAEELEAKLVEYGAENEEKDGAGRGGYLDNPTFICEVETPDKTKILFFVAPTPALARKIWDHDLF